MTCIEVCWSCNVIQKLPRDTVTHYNWAILILVWQTVERNEKNAGT